MSQVESTEKGATEKGANVRFPPPIVYLISILLGVAVPYVAAPLRVPVQRYVTIAGGLAMVLAGFGLNISAWKWFQRTGQDPKPWMPTPELVFRGPYRYTRNPMYVGLTCLQIGVGLDLNNLWIVLLAAVSLLAVHFIAVKPEERYLTEKFGQNYTSYLAKVRRYF